jgi:hypothetical protein
VGGPLPIIELIIEPSNGPVDVFCATGGGGTDVDKVEVGVEGGSETGGGAFELVND